MANAIVEALVIDALRGIYAIGTRVDVVRERKQITPRLVELASAGRTVAAQVEAESTPGAVERRARDAAAVEELRTRTTVDLPGLGPVQRGEDRHVELLTLKATAAQADEQLRKARVDHASEQVIVEHLAKATVARTAYAEALQAPAPATGNGVQKGEPTAPGVDLLQKRTTPNADPVRKAELTFLTAQEAAEKAKRAWQLAPENEAGERKRRLGVYQAATRARDEAIAALNKANEG